MWKWIAAAAFVGAAAYLVVQNFTFGTKKVRLPMKHAVKPLVVTHLSDLHGRRYAQDIPKTVQKQSPDLIVLTGDMFDERADEKSHARTMRLLQSLCDVAPCYAVLGNHEHRMADEQALVHDMRRAGVHVLCNDVHMIFVRGQRVAIAGLDAAAGQRGVFHSAAPQEKQLAVLKRLSVVGQGALCLVLDHYPENFALRQKMSYNQFAFDVMFCGHAHGGQVRVPLLGALYAPGQGVLPRYTQDVYGKQPPVLVVSRGLGGRASLLRVNNRPQIVSVSIEPDKTKD